MKILTLSWLVENGLKRFSALLFMSTFSYAHEYGIKGEVVIDWHTAQISRVVATRLRFQDIGKVVTLGDKQCLEGRGFSFDVRDDFAFDIDETVQVEVEYYLKNTSIDIEAKYKLRGEVETAKATTIPTYQTGSHFYKHVYALDSARFANLSPFNTDFSIGLGYSPLEIYNKPSLAEQTITICNISLKRSHLTPEPDGFGHIALDVRDETGRAVPVRVGIYDASGRLPFPSEKAVAVRRGHYMTRIVDLNPSLIPWPVNSRSAFYINGQYHARLPEGEYELIISKGPEYRIIQKRFVVEKNKGAALELELERWGDFPAKNWYSGDTHIHYVRNNKDDDTNLSVFTQAEDLHVASILQAGTIAHTFYPQYDWNPVIDRANNTYSFVPGQEDPRTSRLGHTISLNLKKPIRDPQNYMIYRPVFEDAKSQGGVTGYAHVAGSRAWAPKGAALDVPLKLVDFFEVMQGGFLGTTERWFDFLNLGYKLAPSAGTDYMHNLTLPGSERSYVYVEEPFSLQGWFDGLRRGETFVTTGPMLEFTINGKPIGSELHLKTGDKIVIEASASINPDIDFLGSLELIEQGEVIKAVTAESLSETKLVLRYETTAQHGSWFVVRASGKEQRKFRAERYWYGEGPAKAAISGAAYVYVDGENFWKPSEVPAIVEQLKLDMAQMMAPASEITPPDAWKSLELTLQTWGGQKPLLEKRIEEVMPIYDDLLTRARAEIAK